MARSDSPPRRVRGSAPPPGPVDPVDPVALRKSRRMLLVLLAVCLAPVIASYLTYYVIKPKGGVTNYGTLIQPQRPIPPQLSATDENGKPIALASLKGKWLMISADPSACGKACATKLYFMRQVRASQGVERERIVDVWLRLDDAPVPKVIETAYPHTRKLRVEAAQLGAWLPAGPDGGVTGEIYLVDPNGNLMMRFAGDSDPTKIKKDMAKLLKWSGIG